MPGRQSKMPPKPTTKLLTAMENPNVIPEPPRARIGETLGVDELEKYVARLQSLLSQLHLSYEYLTAENEELRLALSPDIVPDPIRITILIDEATARMSEMELQATDDPVAIAKAFCARHGLKGERAREVRVSAERAVSTRKATRATAEAVKKGTPGMALSPLSSRASRAADVAPPPLAPTVSFDDLVGKASANGSANGSARASSAAKASSAPFEAKASSAPFEARFDDGFAASFGDGFDAVASKGASQATQRPASGGAAPASSAPFEARFDEGFAASFGDAVGFGTPLGAVSGTPNGAVSGTPNGVGSQAIRHPANGAAARTPGTAGGGANGGVQGGVHGGLHGFGGATGHANGCDASTGFEAAFLHSPGGFLHSPGAFAAAFEPSRGGGFEPAFEPSFEPSPFAPTAAAAAAAAAFSPLFDAPPAMMADFGAVSGTPQGAVPGAPPAMMADFGAVSGAGFGADFGAPPTGMSGAVSGASAGSSMAFGTPPGPSPGRRLSRQDSGSRLLAGSGPPTVGGDRQDSEAFDAFDEAEISGDLLDDAGSAEIGGFGAVDLSFDDFGNDFGEIEVEWKEAGALKLDDEGSRTLGVGAVVGAAYSYAAPPPASDMRTGMGAAPSGPTRILIRIISMAKGLGMTLAKPAPGQPEVLRVRAIKAGSAADESGGPRRSTSL
jgi:hypothetical protein